MLKRIIRLLMPPIIPAASRRIASRFGPPFGSVPFFDEAGMAMFSRHVRNASAYVEYGCGGSTIFALRHSGASVVSVDTSFEWVERVRQLAGPHASRLDAAAVDVGPIGEWGTPTGYTHRANFWTYIDMPLVKCQRPDVVLVDGRFRVASFLHALLLTPASTTILFDDYSIRPEYHVVEEICRPAEKTTRMARFVTPDAFDREKAAAMRDAFVLIWQ